jgi:L-ascorbate metabolism protein UlaG (beta-lactamase superfamily)
MMKKIACMFTVLCLTVMLAACGGKSDGGGSAQTPSAERDSKTGISAEPSDPENIVPEMEESAIPADTASEAEESAIPADAASEKEESPADQGQKGRLLYMGHASLRITTPEGKVIYIDPYAGQGYEPAADLILVTHGHYDHFDTDKVENRNPDCRIITWKEALADGTHQTFDLGFAAVEAVEAGNNQYHSTDECVGYVMVLTDGTSVYVTGDTSTTQQMPSLAEKEIDYAFFCCDGIYNMDLEEAAQCAELVGAKHNTPYHMTAADSGALFDRTRAEQFEVPNLLIIEDGQEIELE